MIDRALDVIARAMKIVAAVWLFALSLFILADVLARGLFNAPILGIKEIIANSIVIIAFLQLPYTIRIGAMLRAEVLDNFLPPIVLEFLTRLAYVLGAVLFALLAYAGFGPMLTSWASGEYEGEGGFRVAVYPVRIAIVLCSTLGAVNFLLLAIRGPERHDAVAVA